MQLTSKQITSEFPLTVVRRWTPNSHDQFRGARQAEKATLQLAANAQDRSIQRLIIQLLQALQPEIDQCHQSAEGKDLLREMTARNQKRSEAATEVIREKRSRRAPERYASLKYDSRGGILPHSSSSETAGLDSDDESIVHEEDRDEEYEIPDDIDSEDEMLDTNWEEEDLNTDLEVDNDVANFVNENHPDDETRHKLALLQLPPHKTWTEKDLENELFMRVGLHLLYNKIHGGSSLHLERSIHIAYLQFPQKVIDTMKGYTEATEKQMETAMSI